jgi:hypothetical protein
VPGSKRPSSGSPGQLSRLRRELLARLQEIETEGDDALDYVGQLEARVQRLENLVDALQRRVLWLERHSAPRGGNA